VDGEDSSVSKYVLLTFINNITNSFYLISLKKDILLNSAPKANFILKNKHNLLLQSKSAANSVFIIEMSSNRRIKPSELQCANFPCAVHKNTFLGVLGVLCVFV
jgi:hypothetical protein